MNGAGIQPTHGARIRCMWVRSVWTVAFMLGQASAAWAAADGWPQLPAPPAVGQFNVGQEMTMNGVPVRMGGYVMDQDLAQVRNWYREHMPGQWVENRVGKKLVLGRREGDYFTTIDIEPMLGTVSTDYTRVVVATVRGGTEAPGAPGDWGADAVQALPPALQDWRRRLPMNTQVLSELRDRDDGKDSLLLTAVNRQGMALNEERLRNELEQMGFRLQNADDSEDGSQRGLFFEGQGGEAVVVLGRVADGTSSIFLNVVMNSLE